MPTKKNSPLKKSPKTEDTSASDEVGKRKREELNPTQDNPNADICANLLELAEYEKTAKGEQWKYLAYRKAAQVISEQKTRVKSGAEAKKLEGIGDSIGDKIDEFLATGGMHKVKEARLDDEAKILAELARIPGIGHAHAKKFYDEGIRSIEDLRKNPEGLTDAQKVSLKHLEQIEAPITHAKAKKVEKFLEKELQDIGDFDVTLCGAYRRHDKTITDIIAVICHKESDDKSKQIMDEIVEKLQKSGFLIDTINQSDHRFKGICTLPSVSPQRTTRGRSKSVEDGGGIKESHMVELMVYPESSFYTAILKWTGNDVFVQEMHSKAKQKGFLLNEYGLFANREGSHDASDRGSAVELKSEKDIFEKLEMEYVKPEDRNI